MLKLHRQRTPDGGEIVIGVLRFEYESIMNNVHMSLVTGRCVTHKLACIHVCHAAEKSFSLMEPFESM